LIVQRDGVNIREERESPPSGAKATETMNSLGKVPRSNRPAARCGSSRWSRARRHACALIAIALILWGVPLLAPDAPARADDVTSDEPINPPKKKQQKRRLEFVVTPLVFKKLEAIHALLEEEKTDEALVLLDKLSKRKLSDHEKAILHQTYGFAYSSQSNHARAADSFEKCLATEALPETTLNIVRYNLGQLYMAMDEFERALVELKRWMREVENPGANAYYLIGIAHAQLEQSKEALPYVEKAVKLSEDFNESWRQLLLALYFEEKQYDDAVEVLAELIAHEPRKSYLQQLRGIYGELEQDEKVLAVLELSYRLGYLDSDSELRHLARMYLYHEIPYQAARVMEQGLADGIVTDDSEAWELLANSWIHARQYELALEPLDRAAEKADDGEIYLKLARVYMEDQSWNEARLAVESGIAKGGLRDPGDAQLLLGISNAKARRYTSARDAFQKAARTERSEQSARTWLQHLDRLEENLETEAAEESHSGGR